MLGGDEARPKILAMKKGGSHLASACGGPAGEGVERLPTKIKGMKGEAERERPTAERGLRKKRATASEQPAVGKALRSVYDETLQEEIPADLLDLLGKLG